VDNPAGVQTQLHHPFCSAKIGFVPKLPPLPPLDRALVRAEGVQCDALGCIEALVPATDVYTCGDPNAPALLLVPGLGVDGLSFIRQLPLGAVSDLRLLQVPNGPFEGGKESRAPSPGEGGRGRPPLLKGAGALEQFAHCAEAYILASKLDQRPGGLVLGGASMGGAISLLIAARGRVKLRGLVLIGTFGSCRQLRTAWRWLAPLGYVVPFGAFRRFSWLVKGWLKIGGTHSDEARWMGRPLLSRTHGYFGRAICGLTRHEVIDAARQLRVPTLVLHGAKDSVLPLAAGEELARVIPGARFVAIEGGRHSCFFSHAEVVNAAIEGFIASIRSSSVTGDE
jgi:pimeloyl-ACP methyl ester carboxylesterase